MQISSQISFRISTLVYFVSWLLGVHHFKLSSWRHRHPSSCWKFLRCGVSRIGMFWRRPYAHVQQRQQRVSPLTASSTQLSQFVWRTFSSPRSVQLLLVTGRLVVARTRTLVSGNSGKLSTSSVSLLTLWIFTQYLQKALPFLHRSTARQTSHYKRS